MEAEQKKLEEVCSEFYVLFGIPLDSFRYLAKVKFDYSSLIGH